MGVKICTIKNITKVLVVASIAIFKACAAYGMDNVREVDSCKEWNIRFNKAIDPYSLYNNIVIKDSKGDLLKELKFTIIENGQTVKVRYKNSTYKTNETYILTVTKDVKDLKGKKLVHEKIIKFKIGNKSEEHEDIKLNSISIMGEARLDAQDMSEYVLKHNKNPKLNTDVYDLAKMFLEEGKSEGVRGDLAFCQSIKETGFFKYGGQVLPEQNNYAGIGAVNHSSVGKGAWFNTPREGVRAQIQHLKGYAAKEKLNNICVDPRYSILKKSGILGIAPNWEDLNGKWAVPGKDYGEEIMDIYMRIQSMV